MQFFPHIESGNSSPSSSSAGFFADKPADGGFASLLSSHLDEHGMSGDGSLADNSVSHAQTSDSSASTASLPKSSSSESELETSHKSTSSTGESVPEDSLEHEVLALDKEATRLEILAGDQQELSAKAAASDARRKDLKRGQDGEAAVTEGRGKETVVQDIAGMLRKLEPLLGPNRQARMEAEDKLQAQDQSIRGALGQLQKLVDATRKKMADAGSDAGNSVRSELEQITTHDLGALQEGIRDILRIAQGAMRSTLQEGKSSGNAGRKESLEVEASKKNFLSAQEQEFLREVLAKLEGIRASSQKNPLEKTRGPVRQISKHETATMAASEEKAEQKQAPGAKAPAATQAIQSGEQSSSVQLKDISIKKSLVQKDQTATMASPEHKIESAQTSGKEEVAIQAVPSRLQDTSAAAREISAEKSLAQKDQLVVGGVVSESAPEVGEKQVMGKFFRDSASKGGDRIEEKILDRSEKLEPVSPRGTPDNGRIQHMKMPEADGVFAVQPNAASSFNTSGPGVKSRNAEVYRQVETGAFRDLGQGNKQLVIRLDPPDLGQVSVVLQVRGKEVQAVLRTSNQEASQALADQLGQLRSQLESQGLRVSRLEVQTQLADSQTDSQWQGAEQHNRYQENRELAMTAQRLRSLGRVESTLAQDVQTSHHKENISLTGVDVFA